jgi:histidyl-tRNA synthetase
VSERALRAVKGTQDILPAEAWRWQKMEREARRTFRRYGYREMRTPIFEETQLFARGIGSETDIVSKEMYTFTDRGGDSLTLRPEATAGIVRAVIEHSLYQDDPALKVFTFGPMFRAENVQRGRYRQFHQVDLEAFGIARPSIDAEVIEVSLEYLRACGLVSWDLVLNSVGDHACRPAYVETLRGALRAQAGHLCADCRRRTETNPLRVLDCKVPEDQPVIEALPRISDHLCPDCRDHFAEVRRELELLEIPYRLSHRLVRGLDYYTRTTFEVVSGELGAQNSVLGGGRYDGLVKDLGGPDLTGIGFALGMERLGSLMPDAESRPPRCDVFLAVLAPAGLDRALKLQRALRQAGLSALMDHEGRGLKSQMKRADKLAAPFVAILGEDELARGEWTVRDMATSQQRPVAEGEIVKHFRESLDG